MSPNAKIILGALVAIASIILSGTFGPIFIVPAAIGGAFVGNGIYLRQEARN